MNWWDITKETLSANGCAFEERPLQREVIKNLQSHFEGLSAKSSAIQPILIRLPCGYGKTIIGEIPFIAQLKTNNWLTRGACYVLPTKALTKHHENVIKKHITSIDSTMKIKAFHGEEHGTNLFYADVAVSTFDTFAYAYARSSRTGHHLEFPAGTIASSYVVFDEAHMLRDDYAYTHSILNSILKILCKSGIPAIIMTATMPKPIEDIVFDGLKPQEIPNLADNSEREQINALLKNESYRGNICSVETEERATTSVVCDETFLSNLSGKRVLIICNTVPSAQTVFESLRTRLKEKGVTGEIILLHSRLIKDERNNREILAKKLMSRERCSECGKGGTSCISPPFYLFSEANKTRIFCEECASKKQNLKRIDFVIVVATQIVEAGLDITSDILVTECAPIDSLIQRTGRCARFRHEKGYVKILYFENVGFPYPENLVVETWKILKHLKPKDQILALTDFSTYMPLLNEGYKTFQRYVPTYELRNYLAYLEGSGFSTFTIDWQTLKNIKARPNAPITLVIPDKSMLLRLAEDHSHKSLVKTGQFRSYTLLPKAFSYEELLVNLPNLQKEKRYLLLESNYVSNYSLSMDLNYAIEKIKQESKPKSFLLHKVADKDCLIELNLTRARTKGGKITHPYILSSTRNQLSEGTYLVNPAYYDSMIGLKLGEKR
jgi:CRISPR/Cas system-associated endonuclease/helicase Cas3